jgi:outer membrane protein
MKMKNKLWKLMNSTLVVALIIFVFFNFLNTQNSNIVFLDNIKLYKEFNMTSDLGKQNEEKFKNEIVEFDSLVKSFKQLEDKLKAQEKITDKDRSEYAKQQKVIIEKERQLVAIKEHVKNEINTKVWERLNSYIEQYGKENKIDILFGAQGNGNIMYGDKEFDITTELIEFSNHKYEGN